MSDLDQRSDEALAEGVPFCIAVFLVARVVLSLIGVATVTDQAVPEDATSGYEVPATPGWHNALDGLRRWDAFWFERIASEGYREHDADAAFFPGYPVTIWTVAKATPVGEAGSATLVSNAAFLGVLIVLYGLTLREYTRQLARRAVVLVTCYPASFFFFAPYSESLFLLLSLLTFLWIRGERWGRGAVAAFAATLTRSIGVALAPALIVEAWDRGPSGRTRRMITAIAPLVAVLAYGVYWLARSGDVLWPLHAQASWHRALTFPLWTVTRGAWLGLTGVADPDHLYRTADLLLASVLLVPLIIRWHRIPTTYLVYVATIALVLLSYASTDRPLLSDPRLLLVAFPAFWALADLLPTRWFMITIACFAVAYVVVAAAFMDWAFVF